MELPLKFKTCIGGWGWGGKQTEEFKKKYQIMLRAMQRIKVKGPNGEKLGIL